MAMLREKGVALLGTASGINMQTAGGAQTIFTTPVGKVTRIVYVVIRDVSATLAGGNDFDFTDWLQTVDLSGMTTANTRYRILHATHNTDFVELAAATNFQITPATGSTGAATATIDVFGYCT